MSNQKRHDRQSIDYFDIDNILATQERIPCKFELTAYNLGYLDPGSDSKDLAVGTKLELPLWLARSLCSRQRFTVSTEIPRHYKQAHRQILEADPVVVDLHKLGPYYYVFGTQLLALEHAESPDIARSILLAFQSRLRYIMDASQNSLNQDTTLLTAKLDEMERVIFKWGQQGLHDFAKWETRRLEKLVSSRMVTNHRKRKRAEMEVSGAAAVQH